MMAAGKDHHNGLQPSRIQHWSSNVVLTLISIIIGLFIFEHTGKYIFKDRPNPYNWDARFMMFSASDYSSVFRNVDDFFTYSKNTTIHLVTYYSIDGKFVKEYD